MSLNGDIPLNKVAYYHSYEYNSLPQLNSKYLFINYKYIYYTNL